MGVVVAATHLELDQQVALKFMHENVVEVGLERFLREAKAVAKLKSEYVARVMDVGKLDGGATYIVMDYLEGEDLADMLDRGALPVEQAVDLVLQAAVALAEAHSRGIVHRDIKPRNLFLTRRPDGAPLLKVLDFGISKMPAGEADGSSTQTGATIGSPSYMSPEQVRSSKDVDARTDVWSLGAVLYQLLTGRLPFVAHTVPDMFVAILHGDLTPASSVAPSVPVALDAVIAQCLAKERAQRFATMAELAQALEPFASPDGRLLVRSTVKLLGGVEATRLTPMPTRPSAPAGGAEMGPTTPGVSVSQAPAPPNRRSLLVGAGVGAVVLLGLGAVVLMKSGGSERAAASAAAAIESVAPEPTASSTPEPEVSAPPAASVVPEAGVAPEVSAEPAVTEPKPVVAVKPKPAPVAKPAPTPKPAATPKPKPPEDDPFGTVQ